MIRVPSANERRVWAFEMAMFMEATNSASWIIKKDRAKDKWTSGMFGLY